MISTISTKGQIVLPKALREMDRIQPTDDFRVTRLGPGRYLYERVEVPRCDTAKLKVGRDGLPVFKVPAHAPAVTTADVKRLESELP